MKENKKTENHEKQRLATFKRLKRGDYNELVRKIRLELANSSGWPWRQKKKKEQDWRMMQILMTQVGHGGDGRRKKSKTGDDGSYSTAHVSPN